MPKYKIIFTHREEDSIELEAITQEKAIAIFPTKLKGFEGIEFSEIECLDIHENNHKRCDNTIDLFIINS